MILQGAKMRKTLLFLFFLYVCAAPAPGTEAGQAAKGKFCIVGMGTAPDLITIRGVEIIRSADIILIGNEQDRELWSDYTRNKEIWYCPDWIRVMYGVNPQTIGDPKRRVLSEKGAAARQELAGKIRSAVGEGKIVVFLQGGDPMMYGLTLLL
jgi:precorrin-2 methylase